MRINTYLAQTLGWSRRQADKAIDGGAVKVNGTRAHLGQQVDPKEDRVLAYGKPLASLTPAGAASKGLKTVILYKPRGYVSTRNDPQHRKTVIQLLPADLRTLKPAGRLDYDTEGLLLLSNDGTLINQFTHPRYETEKEYIARVERPVTKFLLNKMQNGVALKEGVANVDNIEKLGTHELRIIIHQGWNRQIRRMVAACNNAVLQLTRVRISDITLEGLQPGEWKPYRAKKSSKSQEKKSSLQSRRDSK